MSAVTSNPRSRACLMRASTCAMRPQFFLYAVLRCQISTGICAFCAIWIDVSGDVQSTIARLLDAREHVRHAAPVLFVCSFEVPDLDGDLRLLRDLDRCQR